MCLIIANGGGGTNEIPRPAAASRARVWTYPGFTNMTHGLFVGGVGTDAPESLAILPNVSPLVCPADTEGFGVYATQVPPVQGNAALNWTVVSNTISQPGGQAAAYSATTISRDGAALLTTMEFACVNNNNTGLFLLSMC